MFHIILYIIVGIRGVCAKYNRERFLKLICFFIIRIVNIAVEYKYIIEHTHNNTIVYIVK